MLRDELLMPALSMLPQGGWLNSDNAIKPLTSQAWEMVEMYAEEYAARVIIPDNVEKMQLTISGVKYYLRLSKFTVKLSTKLFLWV